MSSVDAPSSNEKILKSSGERVHEKNESTRLIEEAVHHAAHLLPDQGPISVFIHHNTLHAFQNLPFHQAVKRGKSVYGGEPYLGEEIFWRAYREGRITDADLNAVLMHEPHGDEPVGSTDPPLLLREFQSAMLRACVAEEGSASIEFRLSEENLSGMLRKDVNAKARERIIQGTQEWLQHASKHASTNIACDDDLLTRSPEELAAQLLWKACESKVGLGIPSPLVSEAQYCRPHRDFLFERVEIDIDTLVHPVLIRWLEGYLDQGMAYWPMPARSHGFFSAVRELVIAGALPPTGWLRDIRESMRHYAGRTSLEVVENELQVLGLDTHQYESYIHSSLLALPGWAGMMSRLERRPGERRDTSAPASLMDVLAVRLVFERQALAWVASQWNHFQGSLAELGRIAAERSEARLYATRPLSQTYVLFHVCQVLGIGGAEILKWSSEQTRTVLRALAEFHSLERRRIWHNAYEHHYRVDILDALAEHRRLGLIKPTAPIKCQVFFCIDDREEAIRRHLEEAAPDIETFGVAGFFGLAMDYLGLDDPSHAALCPVVVTPAHEIEEHPIEADQSLHERRKRSRRLWAQLLHQSRIGSRSFVRGTLTSALGLVTAIPLLVRVLFPHLSTTIRRTLGRMFFPQPRTQLLVERQEETLSPRERYRGFTLDEQVQRVAGLLESGGLINNFSPLVVLLGHGSSSLNNPHESAYDCGACGGRRGGPNARLFAYLANREDVRKGLAQRGIHVPDTTWFIGGIHDTCSDAVIFSDTESVPKSHQEIFSFFQRSMERARKMSAHERCRRFMSAPSQDATPDAALAHVEVRSEHLAEPRPEYGHCTNAICVVGRRQLTQGLYLDRRAFLVSYDPSIDAKGTILERVLAAVGPVGAGISLEYYFSCVDNEVYGCGTKLPHNVTDLLGVMNGAGSDLRTGLTRQMIELHEPMRLLLIVEALPSTLMEIAGRQAEVRELVVNEWIQLVTVHPETGEMQVFESGQFVPYQPSLGTKPLRVVSSSTEWYRGRREHLKPARIEAQTHHHRKSHAA